MINLSNFWKFISHLNTIPAYFNLKFSNLEFVILRIEIFEKLFFKSFYRSVYGVIMYIGDGSFYENKAYLFFDMTSVPSILSHASQLNFI